jgi:hypothetical protein
MIGTTAAPSPMSSSASLIVVASNDPAVKKECQHQGAAAIDLYLDLQDTHTSKGGLQASAAAFTDFFVMLDSGGLVKAASSLSAVVTRLSSMSCFPSGSKTPEGQAVVACSGQAQAEKRCRGSVAARSSAAAVRAQQRSMPGSGSGSSSGGGRGSAQSAKTTASFAVGDRVELRGIQYKPELNAQRGAVINCEAGESRARCTVHLDSGHLSKIYPAQLVHAAA